MLLVTGGAGFIGANFVRWVCSGPGKNAQVVVLDALTYAGDLERTNDLVDTVT